MRAPGSFLSRGYKAYRGRREQTAALASAGPAITEFTLIALLKNDETFNRRSGIVVFTGGFRDEGQR